MKKRILSFALVLCMLLTLMPFSAFADKVTVGSGNLSDTVTWVLDSEGTLTFSGTGALMRNLSPEWNEYSVKKVVIEDGITAVPDRMFSSYNNLTEAIMPASVRSIGNNAFSHCEKLANVTLPVNGALIGKEAFYSTPFASTAKRVNGGSYIQNYLMGISMDAGKDFVVEEGTVAISFGAFTSNADVLTSVKLPSSLKVIGNAAFRGTRQIKTFNLPAGLEIIGDEAFAYDYFTSIVLPDSLTYIGYGAFNYANKLTSISIPDSVTYLGPTAFQNCSELETVKLSSSLDAINDNTFNGCSKLKSVSIPEGVSYVGVGAFEACPVLTEVVIPSTLTRMGNNAFDGCYELKSIELPGGLSKVPDYAFNRCYALASVKLSEGTTEIGRFAFYGCGALTELDIPSSVRIIGERAMNLCSALEKISYNGTIQTIGNYAFYGTKAVEDALAADGCFIFSDWLVDTAGGKLIIPDGTVGICYNSLSERSFDEIHVPASVQYFKESFGYVPDLYYYGTYAQWVELGVKNVVNFQYTTVHFVGEGGHEHDYTYDTTTVKEGCLKDGYTRHTCECGAYYDDNIIPAHHNYGEWKITTAMDCFTDQVETRICKSCNHRETRVIPTNGHQYEDHVCTVCGWHECTFTDIENSGYREYIETAAGLGIIAGYNDNTYRPNADVTRGQFVTFLWRLCGEPDATGTLSFPDVTPASPYYKAILWAAENGITTGYGDGTFRPSKVISRAEMSTFAFRFLIDPSKVTPELARELYASVGFKDENTIANAFKNPVCAMANLGIVTGFGDGTFRPNQTANRGQAAAIILRVYALMASM